MPRAVHYLSPHDTRTLQADDTPGSELVAVVDYADEAYVLATVPIMRGRDATLLRRRRLEREFPGATLLSGDFASGYTVPGLRASATGTVCAGAGPCERYDGARAYHDHNWGIWRGVTWEWGAARAGDIGLLFGRVQPPDSLETTAPLFVYVTDSLGFVGLFRPAQIRYEDGRAVLAGGRPLAVPSRGLLEDVRGTDTLRLELLVDDAVVTDTRIGLVERGESALARQLARPWFVQMQGRIRLELRTRGRRIVREGSGFFETYR